MQHSKMKIYSLVSEEKKVGPVRHVISSASRMAMVTQANRNSAQLMDKLQPKTAKQIFHSRSPSIGTSVLTSQAPNRSQIRPVSRNPAVIKTTNSPSTKALSPAGRGQRFSLSQNSGKFVTSGPNIILLESSSGQNRPVILPFSST